ncbi:hypothetical protein HG535_0B06870 [Zygotorulaspora mrakii]|uniref:RNA helicase n=1 Tax=Zygotorulaspora mrakii TaxID=42260 RepID=A0A7H9AZ80_ZYGMR|nr:uncharacterized protein HG535_0B06870 [Zygotorulaspora mrakii]QLG71641.1 hypothetical protein HG535_0B06870 [Zygotorulaspora mrakii]
MAKKGKSSSSTQAVQKTNNSKKQARSKVDEINETDCNPKLKQQANRAKVTSSTSWTGKLPHTLLHEACQKRKWNKVEYDMKKIGDKGMLAIAVISWTNPKTKEVIMIKLNDPTYDKLSDKGILVPQETPMEARHFAATVALYRISYHNNLHMMLPPNHKKLWYELSAYRTELMKHNPKRAQKLFDVDPFKAVLEDRKEKEKNRKEQDARFNQAKKEIKAPVLVSHTKKAFSENASKEVNLLDRNKKITSVSFPKKVWENAPFIDLDESSRQAIESSLKVYINWSQKKLNSDHIHSSDRENLRHKLLSLSFRVPHVEEAMHYKDPISFLLFNLPEDDLPAFFHKRREDSKVVVQISSLPLSVKNSIERLVESGVSRDEAWFALENSNMNEGEAAGKLLNIVLPGMQFSQEILISEEESIEIWNEELESLKSIYENQVEIINPDACYIIQLIPKLKLKLKVYRTKSYPSTLPGIIVSTFDRNYKLPDYIKHQILIKLLQFITENQLLGEMLVYQIYEWLVSNLEEIIENPGPLLSEEEVQISLENNGRKHQERNTDSRIRQNRRFGTAKTLNDNETARLQEEYLRRIKSAEFLQMQNFRSKLPAWQKQGFIINLVEQNEVILITGETGSGKSTQVVQFILDSLQGKKNDFGQIKIICTQPRRISAIGLAERVSDERCTECGDEVGYIIRGVNNTKNTTRIKFMTTGVLVRMLQGDKNMLKNTIVVIDEVHERSIGTDLVVILLKNLLGKIPGLKIVLMSATVDVKAFEEFFPRLGRCHIEGRTFPIKDYFLDDVLEKLNFKIKIDKFQENSDEDSYEIERKPNADSRFFRTGQINYDLIRQLVQHIDAQLQNENDDGSIIVFLPGVAEINRCCKMISSGNNSNNFVVLPLHSALTPEDQRKVFKKFSGRRKVIVSTNIAETSITIDDCVAIIDSGRSKTMFYNPRDNTTRLVENFISKAEAKQRRGRAGRVREGLCYKLFSRKLYDEEMIPMPPPEIKRVSLESLFISVKAMGIKDVKKFLAHGLDPPPLKSLEKASGMLTTIGLLNEYDSSLTELGKFISLMPVMDSKHGKLLIYSNIFGVSDLGILIASILSLGTSPFIGGFENRDDIKKILSKYENRGDLLAMTEILNQYFRSKDKVKQKKFMKDNLLSYNKIREIASTRAQFYSILKDVGFLPVRDNSESSSYLNRNQDNVDILKAVITGAFYPNVARVQLPDTKYLATRVGAIEKDADAKAIKYWIRNEEYIDELQSKSSNEQSVDHLPANRAFIHPSSVLFSPNEKNLQEMKILSEDDLQHKTGQTVSTLLKSPFIVFNGSQVTTKRYLRDITPTSTLSLLLLGGPIGYDVSGDKHSPGIVLDSWLAIRTWCKNGVLIKELRSLLDEAIKERLESPQYASNTHSTSKANQILKIVENLVCIE